MPNYRISLDLVDIQLQIFPYDLREYRSAFTTIFIEAVNADDACHTVVRRLKLMLLRQDSSIETRILCRDIGSLVRIDKIEEL